MTAAVAGAFCARYVADTAELAALFRVRHEVYRLDMGLSADAEDAGSMEQDAYDAHSVHIACFHDSGRIAGYARLICGTPDLPTLVLYDLGRRFEGPAAEVSRLIVTPEFRRSDFISRLVRMTLFELVERAAHAHGVANLFSFGRPAVFTLLRGGRAVFEPIKGARPVNLHLYGPMYRDFFARGEVVPVRVNLIRSGGQPGCAADQERRGGDNH
jgi:N-acyl-L-homoserine lactone synthetase